jgi:hypothetical protein
MMDQCTHNTSEVLFEFEHDGYQYSLHHCIWACQQVYGQKLQDGTVLDTYHTPILAGHIIDPDLLGAPFEQDELLEIGFHDDDGEPCQEDTAHLWAQTYGTWNPHMLDFLNADQVQVTAIQQDWRAR